MMEPFELLGGRRGTNCERIQGRPVLVSAFSHSKNPVLTTTQRRFFRIAPENVGSFETVSLRALINGGFAGAFGCAHDGTKPH